MEKHVAARGFCLCHLIFVWYHTGKIGLYLGYYNVGYEERLKRFKCDEQIYVHLMTVVHLMTSLMYLCLSQRWIEDKFACLLYVPLYVYFIMLRNHVTELLNQCAGIHKSLQRIMGNRFCVELRRECIYALLLNVVFLLVIIWKVRIYSGYQTAFIAGVSFIYYLELLFFGNYLIWLGCIYRSMNEFVSQHMRSDRLDILKGVLKQQTTIWRVHRNVSRYFGLHILSLMIQPGVEILKNIHEVNVEIIPLILNLINLALLLLIALNLQKKYAKFQRSYLKLGDDPNYFVLKSWRLLQHRTLPQAFGITLMRKREKLKYKQDIVTMMYSNNFPAVQLVKSSLIITSFAFKNLEIPLTLSMLRTCLKSHLRELLTLLVLRLLFNKNINLEYEHESQQDNFNDNVTQTISQVYRFYFYDEFDYNIQLDFEMARIHFIFGLVKVLRYPLSIFGFLQLKYIKSQKSFQQRDSCYRFVPVLLVTLILVLYLDRRVQLQKENDLVNSLKIESRPVENWFDKWNDDLQVMSIFLVMIWSLFRRALLWHLVNDAQLAHKKLKSLLGKRLTFNCSWLVFNYGIILTLLLIIFLGKILYLDLPHKESEANTITQKDLYEFLNYAMGLPRLMFVMIMALHILYHLINAGWLYSLANLRLPRNPKLFKFQLENLFPFQKRANLLAGLYFRVSYILFFWMVVIRLSDFLRHCRFDTKEFAQLQKSLDDREDEAEWDGVDFEKLETSEDLLFKTSLTLSWHLAMWMLLIASAYTQQEEYYNLIEESFEVEFDGKDLETKGFLSENSWNGHTFNKLDIIDMLFHSGVCIGDLQSNSICFLTDRLTKKKSSYIDLDCVAGPFKFILNLSISAALGYFAQQLELRHLQAFIKQEA